ncbi:MAG TPA: aminoglycoside phosphotransferase family protein [Anaerolineales bacterium]|nr:aminoglycoside phosphotransferase family protein [Anaerolineales bacterium]
MPRLTENGWMVETEYDRLVELWSCAGEEAAQYVPKPYGMTALQERPVLVISYVPGESLARLSHRSFWRNSDQVWALAREAARSLRDLNRLTERPIEHAESLDSHFLEKADRFRTLFQLTRQEDQALWDLVNRVESIGVAASHKVLIQGDFWHGNMIRSKTCGKLMLVDWQFARWSADVSMDVYFFLLAGALSATEGAAVEQRAREAFRLVSQWRANVIPEYLAVYGQPDRHVLLPLKYGMLLCCVEKAVRPALEFGYSHPDDAVWRHLFAELINWPDEE